VSGTRLARAYLRGYSPEIVRREEWPEDFWKAFEGMPADFERPAQVRQRRESLEA